MDIFHVTMCYSFVNRILRVSIEFGEYLYLSKTERPCLNDEEVKKIRDSGEQVNIFGYEECS